VAGIGADWQATTKALDYQKGQVIDLLASCGTIGASCGNSSGVNPQVGVFYAVPSGQVRFTVSRKTRLPSLKDRYSYKMGAATPNPGLRAEHNLTFEAGYQGTLGSKTSFQASAFYSRITDLIQKFYVSSSVYQLQNIGEASHAGFELDARTMIVPHLDLGANYTFLERKNISDPSVWLIDSPRHKGRVSVTATINPSVRVVAGLEYETGRRTQNEGGKYLEVPAFATASVKVSWSIVRQLDLEGTVLNAFDKNYWVSEGYPEAGQTVMAGIRYRF
jgi:iron complex outermembrane recepter protein